jgi:hypothetical protein
MNKKEVKELKELGFDKDELKDIYSNVNDNKNDFEIGNHRFISDAAIDEIQQNELSNDTYILGCFSAWFIADILDISTDAVEKFQKAEAFDGLGELLLPHIEEVQQKYVSSDGYGHHFSSYDGSDNEVFINDKFYHVFRTN